MRTRTGIQKESKTKKVEKMSDSRKLSNMESFLIVLTKEGQSVDSN